MSDKERFPVFETEFLSKPADGIVTITTYYSDGSKEEREVPKYIPVRLLVPSIDIW